MYQVHIEHEFGSRLGHYYRVQIALLDPNRCYMKPYTHEKGDGDNESHPPTCTYTLIQTPTHALKHTHTYKHHTYLHIPTIHPCMHVYTMYTLDAYTHACTYTQNTPPTYANTHTPNTERKRETERSSKIHTHLTYPRTQHRERKRRSGYYTIHIHAQYIRNTHTHTLMYMHTRAHH